MNSSFRQIANILMVIASSFFLGVLSAQDYPNPEYETSAFKYVISLLIIFIFSLHIYFGKTND